MMICQCVFTEYDKKSKNAPYAAARRAMPSAYELPDLFLQNACQSHWMHWVHLRQDGLRFDRRDSFFMEAGFSFAAELWGFEIKENNIEKDIYFTYNSHIGKPVRTYRHAKKPVISENTNYLHSALKEIAFTLNRDKSYGRLTYNGRLTDYDTGEWYYEETIVNIIETDEPFGKDVFTAREPDAFYEQTEFLY